MRDHSSHIEVTREEAVDIILSHCGFLPQSERLPLEQAIGRVLAQDVHAQLDMPNCLICRMDSIAVHWRDFADGMPDVSGWQRGRDWEFANTGVAMPEGYDTAIAIEHVTLSPGDRVLAIDALPSEPYAGTAAPGSKLKRGDLLASRGKLITPLLAAHILSGNNREVSVIRRPRVAFLPTGNELTPAGDKIEKGQNIETNSIMVHGKIRQWGGEPVVFAITRDDPDSIERAVREAVSCSDIVVLNAGTSKGNDDWSIEVVERLGTVYYHQTQHGPGHHSWFAVIEGVPLIGISGPPGGAAFTTDFYLRPVIMHFLGQTELTPKLRVRLGTDLPFKKLQGLTGSVPGEQRPLNPGLFYSMRQLTLKPAADGVLEAFPAGTGRHPDPGRSGEVHAYYLMPTGAHAPACRRGDWIEVELRPGCGPQ